MLTTLLQHKDTGKRHQVHQKNKKWKRYTAKMEVHSCTPWNENQNRKLKISKHKATGEDNFTPRRVTNIRAPLQPRGCPKETAPPCTLTLSCTQERQLTKGQTVTILHHWFLALEFFLRYGLAFLSYYY